jgi:hypothetical protein
MFDYAVGLVSSLTSFAIVYNVTCLILYQIFSDARQEQRYYRGSDPKVHIVQ